MPPVREWLVGHIGFPSFLAAKTLWRGGRVWPMGQLRLFQRLSRSEPRAWQRYRDRLLSALLDHALGQVPFYRGLEERLGGLARERPMEALRLFPIIAKRDQQERGEELLARDANRKRMHVNYTSDSTGEPARFWQDFRRDLIREIGAFRDEMYTGWRPGEPIGIIWSRDYDFPWESLPLYRLLNRLSKMYMTLSPYSVTPGTMREFLGVLERRRPGLLRCYSSAADEFAQFLEGDGLAARARALRLRGIVCSSEKLHELQRERIERVFGCKVFDLYATREMHVIAMECSAHRGLHVSADNVVVEVLDDDGQPVLPGESGRIVVTDLWNFGFALIRYDLGDVGSFLPPDEDPCPCGVTFPRLASVEGRSADYLTLEDGTRIHSGQLLHLFLGFPSVRMFQIVQETPSEFTVRVVGDRREVERGLPRVLAKFPPGVAVNMRYCDEIPLTPGGKRAFIVSKVNGTHVDG